MDLGLKLCKGHAASGWWYIWVDCEDELRLFLGALEDTGKWDQLLHWGVASSLG